METFRRSGASRLVVHEPSADHLIDRRLPRNDVLIGLPFRRRSPKFGMNSRLLRMYVSNSVTLSATFFALLERA